MIKKWKSTALEEERKGGEGRGINDKMEIKTCKVMVQIGKQSNESKYSMKKKVKEGH